MPNVTSIEWTADFLEDGVIEKGYTSNPIRFVDSRTNDEGWFCIKPDDSCRDCYAEKLNIRFGTKTEFDKNLSKYMKPFLVEKEFQELRDLNVKLKKDNKIKKVFICDMLDAFQPLIPYKFHQDIWRTIEECPNLIFQILTKFPTRLVKSLRFHYTPESETEFIKLPKNLWLGFSASDQKTFDSRWRIMKNLRKPFFDCQVIFCSYEPALDSLILPDDFLQLKKHGWIIAGGESGNRIRVRSSDPNWFRNIQKQCKKAGLAYFFKQWGSRLPVSQISNNPSKAEGRYHPLSDVLSSTGEMVYKVYKSATERKLDGVEYNEFPNGVL